MRTTSRNALILYMDKTMLISGPPFGRLLQCLNAPTPRWSIPPGIQCLFFLQKLYACISGRLQLIAVDCGRLQSIAVDCGRLRGTAVDRSRLRDTAVDRSRLRYTAVNCSRLRYTAVNCSRLRYTALHGNCMNIQTASAPRTSNIHSRCGKAFAKIVNSLRSDKTVFAHSTSFVHEEVLRLVQIV